MDATHESMISTSHLVPTGQIPCCPRVLLTGDWEGTHIQRLSHPPVTSENLPIQTHETFWTLRANMSRACVSPRLRFDLSTVTAATFPRKARDGMGGFDPASCSGGEGPLGV